MELLLWRWSTTAQITSELMIAVFFVVLARSVRRVEMRPWIQAWLWNLAALFVTITFWFAQPKSRIAFMVTVFGYTLSKTIFSVLLVAGTWNFVRRRAGIGARRAVIASVVAYSTIAAFTFDTIDKLGTAQSAVIALVLGVGALLLLFTRTPGAGWLTAGLSIRTLLAIVETLAHGARLVPQHFVSESAIGIFVASYSSFDTGAEWVIALGCVLILYRTIQQELTQSNVDLLAAQEVLQELVDRDPLTGLANRRALPEVLRGVFRTGATILFFDLNDFKKINDSYGHQTGDDCLKRFARVLQASFRPDDHVIRYAGDEFVVIAPSADSEQILARVENVRERLKFERSDGPPIKFSVGHASVPVDGDAEAALREADEAMYRQKGAHGGRLRTV
ncbi:MAG: GGDEF domain-containing protein [Acidobacteria bacterium]|nr:GGDEF domain-containing protein [Acidobacteriota bacterium]MBV9069355.1 GGDEF domain-containing protein [Acidobacteriota bacterium]MBV9187153.1 GGDEF domain-containing protein [Acidobacteriota bacterium]